LSQLRETDAPDRPYYLNGLFYQFLPGSDTVPRTFILDKLYTVNERLCPHMHTQNPTFQRRVREKACQRERTFDSSNTEHPVDTEFFARANASAYLRIDCLHKHCDTYLTIDRLHDIGSGVLTAKVHRTFGQLNNVTDPKWLAQLETGHREEEDCECWKCRYGQAPHTSELEQYWTSAVR
jgi:hypothetical protein